MLSTFFDRQPKDKVQQKLGQQLRINRSKIKDTSDTNSDYDDLDSAIRSGYFLKDGLANNEDFYYMNILITVTADSLEELEWRTNEMKKLLLSQDMEAVTCHFREEQAMLSALPLVSLERKLFARSKRNVLTTSVASCYPFTSFEMCDDNGILLGVNKHNNSLIIVDIFNSRVYKNANMALLGTSGAGKTFTMQLMALRMRRKNIQVFIIAPLKGHEFHRACNNIGGDFIQISPASKNCINIMEMLLLFPQLSETAFHSILKQLQKQGRISLQESSVVHLPETECADGMEAAFDVLLDFLPEVTYHAPGEFPVTLTFFAREECYEVIWLPEGKELLVSHALSLQLRPPDNYQRLIVLSSETQLELAGRLPDVTAYCLPRNGKIHYYNVLMVHREKNWLLNIRAVPEKFTQSSLIRPIENL